MTREKVINYLKSSGMSEEQIKDIISAFTCEDCISRKKAEEITWQETISRDWLNVLTEVRDKIRALPSVTPKQKVGEQDSVLDKIRADIEGKYRIILKGTPKDDWAVRWNDCIDEVLEIIDKYKAESESEE